MALHRTAHIRLRVTRRQADRCYGLLRSAGDVWAWVLDSNRERHQQGRPPVTDYQALCRELTGTATFGELSINGARSVPKGIANRDAGRTQNLRLRQWRRTHLLRALRDKATRVGLVVRLVDERGTSSTCPACRRRVPKPQGRRFRCPHCNLQGHRDLVGAQNIAAIGGGSASASNPSLVEHRRAGDVRARRDRRRHLHDRRRRSCLASGRPEAPEVSFWVSLATRGPDSATGEDQAAPANEANVA
jgi:Putative transposase DNA-binding domain